jgi:tetratricopeptide (TPR) repeat protein
MHVAQGWLEWSKLEEDIGNIKRSLKILSFGLYCNPFNENIVAKAIKLFERTRSLQMPRKSILSSLRHENLQNVWKSVFEGALLEARDGNTCVAREFYLYLLEGIHWYGPIYYEAYRLEEKVGCHEEATRIIRAGLQSLPKYGPLWFGLLRMLERADTEEELLTWLGASAVGTSSNLHQITRPKLQRLRAEVPVAVANISKELVWKVYFELSMAEQRAAMAVADVAISGLSRSGRKIAYREILAELLGPAKAALAKAAVHCPNNLRWKVWTAGARLEMQIDGIKQCRSLLCRAMTEVPAKSKSQIYIECARVEEYVGNTATARAILSKACEDVCGDWKLFLEAVLLECRSGRISEAICTAEKALSHHSGTGRLWAILIQLHHRRHLTVGTVTSADVDEVGAAGGTSKHGLRLDFVLHNALNEVPKSGEVWCEAARTHLNPLLLDRFDLGLAQTQLSFAIQFTPQYGDTFIEYLRLEVLTQVLLPRVLAILGLPVGPFIAQFVNNDRESDSSTALLQPQLDSWLLRHMKDIIVDASVIKSNADSINNVRCSSLVDRHALRCVQISELERRCLCADPNYGALWFHCRKSPIDCPTQIMDSALLILSHEICSHQSVYCKALLHYVQRCLGRVDLAPVSELVAQFQDGPPGVTNESSSSSKLSAGGPLPQQPGGNGSGVRVKMNAPHLFDEAVSMSLDSAFSVFGSQAGRSATETQPRMLTNLASSCSSLPLSGADVCVDPLTPRRSREALRHGRLQQHQQKVQNAFRKQLKPGSVVAGDLEWASELASSRLFEQTQLWSRYIPAVVPIIESTVKCDPANPQEQCPLPVTALYTDGEVLACGDFISSIIGFNRLQFRSDTTSAQHRHLLFGTDEIIP